MFRVTLAAALVSIVSGCVTSDPGPLSSQVTKPRSVQSQQAAQTTAKVVRTSSQIARPEIVLGAAY
jgi:hypothetical protein